MWDAYERYMDRVKRAAAEEEPKNEHSAMGQAGLNVVHGLLSGRPSGGSSVLGASVGGAIDGLLLKPTIDAGIGLVGRAARWAYGLGGHGSTNLPNDVTV